MLALSKDVYETQNLNCAVVRCVSASKLDALMYWFYMTLIFMSLFFCSPELITVCPAVF